MNPHGHMVPLDPKGTANRRWRCKFCDARGTLPALQALACTFVYPACKHCGQTPECAADCPAIIEALSDPRVRVIGGKS